MKSKPASHQPTLFDPTPPAGNGAAYVAEAGTADAEQRPGFRWVRRIGWVPQDWDVHRLRDLVAPITSGISVNGSDEPAPEGVPGVLKVSAVTEGVFKPDENKTVFLADLERCRRSVQGKTILMSRANTGSLVAASAYVEQDYPNLYLPDKLWQIQSEDALNDTTRWLAYVLKSPRARAEFSGAATGSSASMKNLSQDAFLAVRAAVPPLSERHKIARILSAWDRALAQLDALIAAKEQRLRGLSQRLLTGIERLPGYTQPWHTVRLGEVFQQRKERDQGDLPLLSVTANAGIVRQDSLARRDTSAADKSKYLHVKPGDIAYNTMRMWQGVSALSSLEGIVSPAYTVCVAGTHIDAGFAAHLFKLPAIIHRFWRYSQGLVSDTLNLKFSNFKQVEVQIPHAVDEQKRIAVILGSAQTEIDLLHQERGALAAQKKGLMQRLLTGEVRVPPDAEDLDEEASK